MFNFDFNKSLIFNHYPLLTTHYPLFAIIVWNFNKRNYLNKILIFAGCQEATLLIQKISDHYLNMGEFHIIYEEDEIKNSFNEKENLFFYKINFYAYELYKNILHRDLSKIIIFVKNKKEAEFILKNSLDNKEIIIMTLNRQKQRLQAISSLSHTKPYQQASVDSHHLKYYLLRLHELQLLR